MIRISVSFLFIACFVALQAGISSSSQLSTQQITAYSTATGFLALCDDGDFKGAFGLYAEPIKSQTNGEAWIAATRPKRALLGAPILRYWVNRQRLKDSAYLTFEFRTNFVDGSLVDEVVSVARASGRWEVYEYNFHAPGKHSSPSATPLRTPEPTAPAQSHRPLHHH